MTGRKKPLVIAIDGPSASGKGTLARKIAQALGMEYLDTGKLYRYVGYKLMHSAGCNIEEAEQHHSEAAQKAARIAGEIDIKELMTLDLVSEGVGKAASIVSAIPAVRRALLDFQRNVAKSLNGAVLDGRDIGTVVCPDADFKFFITADIEARAKRRYKELQKQGDSVIYASVLEDLERRDRRDSQRKDSPLVAAEDATVIDTSHMGIDEVFEKVLYMIKSGTSCFSGRSSSKTSVIP